MTYSIRSLTKDDHHAAKQVLCKAFAQDPIFAYLTSMRSRDRVLECIFDSILTFCQPHHYVLGAFASDGSLVGVAAWLPPGVRASNELRWLLSGLYRLLVLVEPSLWSQWLTFLRTATQPLPQPVWSLQLLGVSVQRQGIGSQLIQPVLNIAAHMDIPCHLETSTEAAVRFYQRYNFEVLHVDTLNTEGVRYWAMQTQQDTLITVGTRHNASQLI